MTVLQKMPCRPVRPVEPCPRRQPRHLSLWGVALAASAAIVWSIDSAGLAAAADAAGTAARSGFRRLAPGVLTVVPPHTSSDSHVLRGDLEEVTRGLAAEREWTPLLAAKNTTLLERAKGREFERDIWCLEFAFKPPRLIEVDVPAADTKMVRKKVWYLVYRVRNTGGRRTVIDKDDPTKRTVETFETPVRFIPHFVLESLEGLADDEGEATYRGYLDRVIPSAMGPIRRREDAARELLDSASMAASDIPPGGERWGVAVWADVDPRLDFFTISVRGLSNAIRWRPRKDATFTEDRPPASEFEHVLQSLQLDFWRPGDDVDEVEEELHVGAAGMFERMTLGSRLLEAEGRPRLVKSRPADGLAELGLTWSDLAAAAAAAPGSSLAPLREVVGKLAGVPEPTARGRIVKALFGDLALDAFEQLSRALAGPVSPERDAVRRQALSEIDLTPEAVERKPLESLNAIFESLDRLPPGAARQRLAEACFGPAAGRVRSLSRELSLATTLATLDDLDLERRLLVAGDAAAAFEVIRATLAARKDAADLPQLLVGLFGPRGPALYEAATKVPEGIDHAWVLRYEIEDPGP